MKMHNSILILLLLILSGCGDKNNKIKDSSVIDVGNKAAVDPGYDKQVQDAIADDKKPAELIYTKEEESQIQRWTGKNLEDIADAASKREIGAIYWIGLLFLMGGAGFAIDTLNADIAFARAASLGFAPALDKIRSMYMDTYNDPFLMLVYVNLVVSSGHLEFAKAYHKTRASMIETFGQAIVKEVERIAVHKKSKILKDQEAFKNTNNKTLFVLKMNDITAEDVLFDMNYWQKAMKADVPENLDAWIAENYVTVIRKSAEKAQESERHLDAWKE